MAERQTTAALEQQQDLPSLLERLASDVTTLFDTKLTLLKIEIKEDVNAYVRASVAILAGGIVAAVGFALVNVALAFAISTLFADLDISQPGKYALGFVIAGVLYLAIGSIVIVIMKNRLGRGIVPERTIDELGRDKEWIQKEL
ncbi:MAG TPA: phage holin family protein [Pyrinomonadaceae bacterium]|nr:phage holin family protein [Pyrinomonadaceae bacterium]